MKPGSPLQRRTPLRRSARLTTSTPFSSSSGLVRGRGVRKESDRRAEQRAQRREVVAQIVAERGDRCEVPGCWRIADDPHEPLTRARGGSITDPANIRLVCRPHHRDITDNEPAWAYRLGFLKHSWDRGDVA